MKQICAYAILTAAIFGIAVLLVQTPAKAGDEIKLKMYVVKATGSGEAKGISDSLAAVSSDLNGTGFSEFELVGTPTVFSLPSGGSEDKELSAGYSVNVTPTSDGKSTSVKVKFHKGTKKVFSGSSAVSSEKNAMFILRGVYPGGALIVIFTLE